MKEKNRILLAEGDRDLSAAIGKMLTSLGYEVTSAFDGVLAITAFNDHEFDLMVIGEDVSRVPAAEVTEIFRRSVKKPVVLIIKNRLKVFDPYKENYGFVTYLTLPFGAEILKTEINRALTLSGLDDVILGDVTLSFKTAKLVLGENEQNVCLNEAMVLKDIAKKIPIKCDKGSVDLFRIVTAINKKLTLLGAKIYIKKTTEGYEIAYD